MSENEGTQFNQQGGYAQQPNGQPQMNGYAQQPNGQPQMNGYAQQPYGQPQGGYAQQPYGQPQGGYAQQPNGQPQMNGYAQRPYGQPQMNGYAQRQASAVDGLMGSLLGLIKTPADTAKTLVSGDSMTTGCIFAGVEAVLTLVFTIILWLLCGAGIVSAIGTGVYMLIFMVAASAIVAAAIYVAGGVIFKSGITMGNAVNAAGIFAITTTVGIVLGCVLEILSNILRKADLLSGILAGIATIVIYSMCIAGVIIVVYGLLEKMNTSSNSKILTLIVAGIISIFLISLFDNIAEKVLSSSDVSCAERVFSVIQNARYYHYGW